MMMKFLHRMLWISLQEVGMINLLWRKVQRNPRKKTVKRKVWKKMKRKKAMRRQMRNLIVMIGKSFIPRNILVQSMSGKLLNGRVLKLFLTRRGLKMKRRFISLLRLSHQPPRSLDRCIINIPIEINSLETLLLKVAVSKFTSEEEGLFTGKYPAVQSYNVNKMENRHCISIYLIEAPIHMVDLGCYKRDNTISTSQMTGSLKVDT